MESHTTDTASQNMAMDVSGQAVVTLAGSFGMEEAATLAQTLTEALDRSSEEVVLSLASVERCGVPFFQLLFALCKQAGHDGKRVRLAQPLSEGVLRDARQLGITQKDFEAYLPSEAI